MKHFESRSVKTCVGITCDRCEVHYEHEIDFLETQEFLSFEQCNGYASVFGDLGYRSIDLCQHCQEAVLGQWMKVLPYNVYTTDEEESDSEDV